MRAVVYTEPGPGPSSVLRVVERGVPEPDVALQQARWSGATVIAIVSSDPKAAARPRR